MKFLGASILYTRWRKRLTFKLVYKHYFNPSHCYEKHVQTAKKMICKFFLIPKKPTKNKNPTPRFGTWEVITTSFGIE